MPHLDQRSCIYCGKVRAFTDEHVFPAGLGGNDNRFLLSGLVCGHCNTDIFSKLELRFMRSSPAAIARIFLQPTGRGRGKKASIPTIDTRSTTIFTENYGAIEAEVTASGKAVLLMQLLFHGGGKVSYTGGAPDQVADFLEAVASTLGDSVFLVQKHSNTAVTEYQVDTVNWNGERFVFVSREVIDKPPSACVWREVLEPYQDGEMHRLATLYRRRAGQIVLRAPENEDVLDLLTQARKAAPEFQIESVGTTAVENPLVQLSMSMDLGDYGRVLAKIGLNLIAYAFGEKYVRHHAFNKIKRAILTGDAPIHLVAPPTTDPFHGVPSDRHVVMVHVKKSRAGRFHVALSIRLYGGKTSWILLSENAIQPPDRSAILVVDFKNHRIEEFINLRQFVMAYPPTPPAEFTRQAMLEALPKPTLKRR
jgi:hypothetical protein